MSVTDINCPQWRKLNSYNNMFKMMTEINIIEGGQKDVLLKRANLKKKKKDPQLNKLF